MSELRRICHGRRSKRANITVTADASDEAHLGGGSGTWAMILSTCAPEGRLLVFRVMGMRLVAGRFFDERDVDGKPSVAIVNQAFARQFKLGDNPLASASRRHDRGVVGDVRHVGLAREAS